MKMYWDTFLKVLYNNETNGIFSIAPVVCSNNMFTSIILLLIDGKMLQDVPNSK